MGGLEVGNNGQILEFFSFVADLVELLREYEQISHDFLDQLVYVSDHVLVVSRKLQVIRGKRLL